MEDERISIHVYLQAMLPKLDRLLPTCHCQRLAQEAKGTDPWLP